MANQIKVKRGLAANVAAATLQQGELAYTTDGKKLYIGDKDGGTEKTCINPDISIPVTSVAGRTGTVTLSTSDISGLGTAATKSTGTASGNVPILNSTGKLDSSVVPAIAISDTFVVANESAMLALTSAEVGDIAVRTDTNKSYILKTAPYSTLGNWQELLTPTSPVQSVAGKTGTVTLAKGDVGLGNVDNTADGSKSVASAAKLTTKRKITLSGAVSGNVEFDGSDAVTLTTTLGDVVIDGGTF